MNRRVRTALAVVGLVAAVPTSALATATTPPGATDSTAGSSGDLSQPLDPPVDVSMSVAGVAPEAGLFIAFDKGYFAEEGINLEFVSLRRFAEALPLLATGEIDFATGGLNPDMFNAVAQGIDINIVGANAVASPGSAPAALIVRQELIDDGTYTDLSDLAGMRIAINGPGSSSQFHVEKMLEVGGLTKDDIEFVVLGFPDMPAGLANGAVDAVFAVEPFVASMVKEGLGTAVAIADEIFTNAINQVIVISPQFASENPEAANRVMYAFLKGQREYLDAFINGTHPENQDEIIEILTRYTPVTDPAQWEGIGYSGGDPNGEFDLAVVEEFQDYFVDAGTVEDPIEDVSEMVDLSYLEYAVDRLGRM